MFKKIFYLIGLLSLIVINPVKADTYNNVININNPSEIEEYKNKDYVIDKYNVDITVNENNTLNITETILAVFKVPKHGIIRNIPLHNNVKRNDGTTTTNTTQVSNVTVSDTYTDTKENNMYVLKIGNANQTLTGNKEYVIKYTYNLGPDPLKNLDEFYFNIIGDSWDTAIGNVTFKITMPKAFDASKLGFSSGYYGSTNNEYVEYNVQGNVITGKYKAILRPSQALTVRLELNEGYFVGAHLNISPFTFLMYLIPALCLALVIFLWSKYGKDEMLIETVEFYPPDNLNSLEIACLYKGNVDADDVVSLLIYLAAKGYLKIEENNIDLDNKKVKLSNEKMQNASLKIKKLETQIALEEKKNPNSAKLKILRNSLENYKNIDKPISDELTNNAKKLIKKKVNNDDNITFIKLKDYDGQNIYEAMFFNGIFENGLKTRKLKALKSSFYRKIEKIISMVQKKYENKAYEKTKPLNIILIILAILTCAISVLFIPVYYNMGLYGLLIVSIILAFLIPFYIVGFSKFIPLGFKILWLSMTGLATTTFFSSIFSDNDILSQPAYVGGLLIGGVCLIIMFICLLNMPKRSNYGNQMKGRIKGFRNFLETVEKDKLEQMVEKNPTYFYDVLPFTYVLGISDTWINKFETIGLPDVNWYNNSSNISDINDFMNHQMHNISSTLSYNPTSYSSSGSYSSSSSSSGGGSSGGGSGGGGGSSW